MQTTAARLVENTGADISKEASEVREALISLGLETPFNENYLSKAEKYQRIVLSMENILETLGMDMSNDSLSETPHRIAKMYIDEIFKGLDYRNFPRINSIDNTMQVDESVLVSNIGVISTCEHHFVTIDGTAKVAYLPKDKVIGLSKINRIVRFFSQRPQVQERLTQQVKVALQTILNTEDVAVHIAARHYCVKARGVMDAESQTETSALGGRFKADKELRREFLSA